MQCIYAYMPTLADYPGVSRIRNESPDRSPVRVATSPGQNRLWASPILGYFWIFCLLYTCTKIIAQFYPKSKLFRFFKFMSQLLVTFSCIFHSIYRCFRLSSFRELFERKENSGHCRHTGDRCSVTGENWLLFLRVWVTFLAMGGWVNNRGAEKERSPEVGISVYG